MKTSDLPARFQSKIAEDLNTGCWRWTAAIKGNGYGNSWLDGRNQPAHRVIYQLLIGKIEAGLDLDHLCRNRICVNPDHLEPVTRSVNLKRGLSGENLAKKLREMTHCKRGHEFTDENTRAYRGHRHCRACARERYHRDRKKSL